MAPHIQYHSAVAHAVAVVLYDVKSWIGTDCFSLSDRSTGVSFV